MGALVRFRRYVQDPVYANGLALVANAGISAALGFLFWMVAARRFNADALGVGAAVVSASSLAALVGKAGFDAAVVRYAPACDARELRRLLLRASLGTLVLTTIAATVTIAVAAAGVPALAPLTTPAFAVGFVILSLAHSTAWVIDAAFIAEQRASLVLARNVAFNLAKIFVPLFIAHEWAGRAVPLAWGTGLAVSLALALAVLPRLLRGHRQLAHSRPEGSAFGYSMRNYALNLSEFAPGLLLPILVLDTLGAEANARFFLAWTAAGVAFLASKAIAQSAFAELVRATDPKPALRKAALLALVVLGPPALGLYVAAPLVLALFGPDYVAVAGLLRLLLVSVPAVAAGNLFLAYLKARNAGWELTLLPIASVTLLLALIPSALFWRGIVGAGLCWLVVQALSGAYATLRLVIIFRRSSHAIARTGLRRHPHEG